MKYLLILLLAGCSVAVPVKQKFPEVPPELMQPAADLNKVPEDTKNISEIIKNTADNSQSYYEIRIKLQAWQEWYAEQKKIFDEVNK
jgi:hypothetical protein